MAYYIDVLTPSTERIAIEDIRREALKYLPECEVFLNEGTDEEWQELIVWINENDPVCTLECSPFTKGESDDTISVGCCGTSRNASPRTPCNGCAIICRR
jgi:hypothetical protein